MYKKIIYLFVIILVFLFSNLSLAEVFITAEEATKQIFPSLEMYKVEDYTLDGQSFKFFTVFKNSEILGWTIVTDEMGKIKPITFLVGIDNQGKVLAVYLLEYRDIFGSEIKRRSFLRQFQGKSLNDPLIVGRDIDAITGATISSQAATSAVRKSLRDIEELQKIINKN